MKANSIWVIVADEARAIIYARKTRRSALFEVVQLDNEKATKKRAELTSDRDGRSFDSHGSGRHSMSNEKEGPKRHAATVFAREIAGRIARARQDDQFRDYAVIAAPRFLGLLRGALSTAGVSEPYLAIPKDVVRQDLGIVGELLEDS